MSGARERQGWYSDPFGVHEHRYFSADVPTRLVRDGSVESYDPPPDGPELFAAERVASPEGAANDTRRADDGRDGAVSYSEAAEIGFGASQGTA